MTDTLELKFEFEELVVPVLGKYCPGMKLYGYAFLEGDEDGFSVRKIMLKGDTWLRRTDNTVFGQPDRLADELFASIASVIENDKTKIGALASTAWADVVEDAREVA